MPTAIPIFSIVPLYFRLPAKSLGMYTIIAAIYYANPRNAISVEALGKVAELNTAVTVRKTLKPLTDMKLVRVENTTRMYRDINQPINGIYWREECITEGETLPYPEQWRSIGKGPNRYSLLHPERAFVHSLIHNLIPLPRKEDLQGTDFDSFILQLIQLQETGITLTADIVNQLYTQREREHNDAQQ